MSDIKLNITESNELDVAILNGDLETDDGLQTAVYLSLFTNRRAKSTETKTDTLGGWWADETLPDKDQIGSLLWTLQRETLTQETILKAKQYAEDSLSWMTADGVAEEILVTVSRSGIFGISFDIVIKSPKSLIHRYKILWRSQDQHS